MLSLTKDMEFRGEDRGPQLQRIEHFNTRGKNTRDVIEMRRSDPSSSPYLFTAQYVRRKLLTRQNTSVHALSHCGAHVVTGDPLGISLPPYKYSILYNQIRSTLISPTNKQAKHRSFPAASIEVLFLVRKTCGKNWASPLTSFSLTILRLPRDLHLSISPK